MGVNSRDSLSQRSSKRPPVAGRLLSPGRDGALICSSDLASQSTVAKHKAAVRAFVSLQIILPL